MHELVMSYIDYKLMKHILTTYRGSDPPDHLVRNTLDSNHNTHKSKKKSTHVKVFL